MACVTLSNNNYYLREDIGSALITVLDFSSALMLKKVEDTV